MNHRDDTARRMRMRDRRERQLARVPGFDAMPNKRVDTAFATAFIGELTAQTEAGMSEPFALACAQRAAMMTLPHLPVARRHRAPRPSKSDDPAYRKQALRACPALA